MGRLRPSREKSLTKRPSVISASDSRTLKLAPPRASDRPANSRKKPINLKANWMLRSRCTMRSAWTWRRPSTSSLVIRRLPPDSRVSRPSRRRQLYHRRRFSSCDCRVKRCSGIRCQNVVCFWDRCQNNGRYDDDDEANLLDDDDDEAETMTSSTLQTGRCFPSESAGKTSYILHHAVPIN